MQPRALHHWPVYVPLLAMGALAATLLFRPTSGWLLVSGAGIMGSVVSAVHHAEVIAHRVGEPFGTLILAIAVTVIEVALVLSVMFGGGDNASSVARDAVFSAIMIICNGVIGVCLLVGGIRHGEQTFRIEGTGSGLAALAVLAALVLVMPILTVSAPGAHYTVSQLAFVALSSLALWLLYVFIQTIKHRDYFLPTMAVADETVHAAPPSARRAWFALLWLLISLTGVIGLAKALSPSIERGVLAVHAPQTIVGVIIAVIVLLPETTAAIRAAYANRMQTSMNLAVGSALASIGLTIPAVVAASVLFDLPLTLGLQAKDIALLALTFIVCSITLGSGRTNLMQGAVHLVILFAFLFLTLVP